MCSRGTPPRLPDWRGIGVWSVVLVLFGILFPRWGRKVKK